MYQTMNDRDLNSDFNKDIKGTAAVADKYHRKNSISNNLLSLKQSLA